MNPTLLKSMPVLLIVALTCYGCTSGNLSQRDDGKYATRPHPSAAEELNNATIRAEADRLRAENPSMSRQDAYEKARKDHPYVPTPAETKQQREEQTRLKEQEAQNQLVRDLDKLK